MHPALRRFSSSDHGLRPPVPALLFLVVAPDPRLRPGYPGSGASALSVTRELLGHHTSAPIQPFIPVSRETDRSVFHVKQLIGATSVRQDPPPTSGHSGVRSARARCRPRELQSLVMRLPELLLEKCTYLLVLSIRTESALRRNVTDLWLPDTTGLEIMEWLRDDEVLAAISWVCVVI